MKQKALITSPQINEGASRGVSVKLVELMT